MGARGIAPPGSITVFKIVDIRSLTSVPSPPPMQTHMGLESMLMGFQCEKQRRAERDSFSLLEVDSNRKVLRESRGGG